MKKLFSILLLFCFIFLTANVSEAVVNSYDRYGSKTGSYRETSSGYNSYDKFGSKTGSYRKTSSGYKLQSEWTSSETVQYKNGLTL